MKAAATVIALNQAAQRARIKGEVGSGTFGSDSAAALAWYVSNGYIRTDVDLFGVDYSDGEWGIMLPW